MSDGTRDPSKRRNATQEEPTCLARNRKLFSLLSIVLHVSLFLITGFHSCSFYFAFYPHITYPIYGAQSVFIYNISHGCLILLVIIYSILCILCSRLFCRCFSLTLLILSEVFLVPGLILDILGLVYYTHVNEVLVTSIIGIISIAISSIFGLFYGFILIE